MRLRNNQGSCLVLFIVLLAFFLAGVTSAVIYFNSLPPISQLQNYQPTFVSQIVASDGNVVKTFGAYKYKKVTIDQIPDNLKKALIATEDKNFYTHYGFDPIALIRSTVSNVIAHRYAQGASTITQQLARILFLSAEKTMDRKLKELVIAYRLEKTLPKDKILEMYLNNVYLGEGAYGAEAAAEVYFNKKVENLSLSECALIAGLPQAPSIYSPYQNMDLAKERRSHVLERMVKMNFITQEQADSANNAPIHISASHRPYMLNKAPYFTDFVMKELREDIGITEQEATQGGYKIYTTLNLKNQLAAERKIESNMARWGLRKSYNQAALVSYDTTSGKILAYVGGKDYRESQYDRVSQAVRQPGSSFKPFVYATAIERGMEPKTVVEDAPIAFGDWHPRNYGNKYRGKIPLYQALMYSSNAVTVRLIKELGVTDVINMARRMGITTPIANDPTIALGSSGVKLMEITSAYAILANGGVKVKPYAIERIETSNGRVIYQASPSYTRVLDGKTVAYMVEMMKRVILEGTGRAANIGRPAAGKTGTTDNYRDAWFIGYTPDIVTGVWVGNDNNTTNRNLTGGTIPASIWSQYMRVAEEGKPIVDFVYPDVVIDFKTNPFAPVEDKSKTMPANTDTLEQEIPDEQSLYNENGQQPVDGQQTVPAPSKPPVPVPQQDYPPQNNSYAPTPPPSSGNDSAGNSGF